MGGREPAISASVICRHPSEISGTEQISLAKFAASMKQVLSLRSVLRERETVALLGQQIRGSCSPTCMEITRVAPIAVRATTIPG